MKCFFKLNVASCLYGLMLFVSIELHLNFYRIIRLTSWESKHVELLLLIIHTVGFLVASILMFVLTRKWLEERWSSYWTAIFWLPYTVLLIMVFANLFPIAERGSCQHLGKDSS